MAKGRIEFGWHFEPGVTPYRLRVDRGKTEPVGFTRPVPNMAEAFSQALRHARYGVNVTIFNHTEGLEPGEGTVLLD